MAADRLTASVVIPVKDGARWLGEVLAAVLAQEPDEVLVIDSGSADDSVRIARAAGVRVLEIAPGDFGHGRTRNLGASSTTGELIVFLTQDATPVPGWLDAHRAAFGLAERVGACFGPHLPRPDTSPMIARELTEFFGGFSPGVEESSFLSNVNASYLRACWEELRFEDVAYSEDQAFARAMRSAGWKKAYAPAAGVLHAHDYPPVAFMRRYFDEYRGLRVTAGHVEPFGVAEVARRVRSQVAGDRAWVRSRGASGAEVARWTARSAVHHGGRAVFSALGSRADRLPAGVQRAISLEGTAPDAPKPVAHVDADGASPHAALLEVARSGVVPLVDPVPGLATAESLHVAVVIPYFRRGSGGHSTIFNLLSRLEERGHRASVWLHDPIGYHSHEPAAVVRHNIREFFRGLEGPVFKGFSEWHGADVAVATGWDTVHPVLRLDHCRARAYLVQDHEPEFFATSAQSEWARGTYAFGLPCIAASKWLARRVNEEYGCWSSWFDLGVDASLYRPRPVQRRDDTVIFYARDVTPRRAVPLGLLALEELWRMRPGTRFVLFGDNEPVLTPFPYEHLGIAEPSQLAWAYSEATAGLSLSMTNYSLIPGEMLACGLPVVELAGGSAESELAGSGGVRFAATDPVAIAQSLAAVLDAPAQRETLSTAGIEWAAGRTWDHASSQLERALREIIALRSAPAPRSAPATKI